MPQPIPLRVRSVSPPRQLSPPRQEATAYHRLIRYIYIYMHLQGVPNGSWRVSIHHPLGFNWHPFEGPGIYVNISLFTVFFHIHPQVVVVWDFVPTGPVWTIIYESGWKSLEIWYLHPEYCRSPSGNTDYWWIIFPDWYELTELIHHKIVSFNPVISAWKKGSAEGLLLWCYLWLQSRLPKGLCSLSCVYWWTRKIMAIVTAKSKEGTNCWPKKGWGTLGFYGQQ